MKKFPDPFYCPVTKEIMKDPVVVGPEGISYERSSAEVRFLDNSPDDTTGKPTFYANRALRDIIARETNGSRIDQLGSSFLSMEKSFRQSMSRLVDSSSSVRPQDCPDALHEAFYCPITFNLMHHPVIDPEGNTFELAAIATWIEKNASSPVTRTELSLSDLLPNAALRSLLELEVEKTDMKVDSSIRKFKVEELRAIEQGGESQRYPTTREELEELQNKRSLTVLEWIFCFPIYLIGVILVAVVYLLYAILVVTYIVLDAVLYCNCCR